MQRKNRTKDTKTSNNTPLGLLEPLKRVNKRRKMFIILFSLSFGLFALVLQLQTIKLSTIVDPEAVDWIPLEPTNTSFENFPWANIVDAKYAAMDKDLYFLVKWDGIIPDSSNDLTKPYYLIHRKVYISWTINKDSNNSTSTKGVLFFSKGFVLFQFIEGAADFQYATHSIPFANETTVAFKIIYQKGTIPIESLSQISVVPAGEFTAYKSYQSDLQSLSDLPESFPRTIKLDGNVYDWSNSDVNSLQMNSGNTNLTNGLLFPFYENLLVTRTIEGIYGAVTFSISNFTQFINTMGNLNINIYWTTVLAMINGSYAADYAFEVYLSFNYTTSYSVKNVSITLLAGYDYPTIFENWQLQDIQSGTDACFEFFFPIAIISPLFGTADNIYFYSSMDIEWF